MWNKYQIIYRQLGNECYIESLSIGRVSRVKCRGRGQKVEGEGKKSRVKSRGLNVDC